jgi:hypothetical protein
MRIHDWQESAGPNGTALEPSSEDGGLRGAGMQPFRQFQQCRSIMARCSGEHYRKARREEGRPQRGPSVWVGLVLGAQIRKTFFQIPIQLCGKVAVRA